MFLFIIIIHSFYITKIQDIISEKNKKKPDAISKTRIEIYLNPSKHFRYFFVLFISFRNDEVNKIHFIVTIHNLMRSDKGFH